MPQLAFANSFWHSFDVLEKPVRAGVRKAMEKFQQLTIAELHADKGLHLESVNNARDPRMRTIRINDFWRGVVLAPDDGSDTFLLLNVVPHDGAYTWAAKRLYTVNTATRALEVRNVVAIEQLTPALEKAAAQAPTLLFAKHSDTALRHVGIDDQVFGPSARSSTSHSWRRSGRCCPKTSSRCSAPRRGVHPGRGLPRPGRPTPPGRRAGRAE